MPNTVLSFDEFLSQGCPLTHRELVVLYNEAGQQIDVSKFSVFRDLRLLAVKLFTPLEGESSSNVLVLIAEEPSLRRFFCYFIEIRGEVGWSSFGQLCFNPHKLATLNRFVQDPANRDLSYIKVYDGAFSAYRSSAFDMIGSYSSGAFGVVTWSLMVGREGQPSVPSPYYVTSDFWWLIGDQNRELCAKVGATYEQMEIGTFRVTVADLKTILFDQRDHYYTSRDC